MKKAIFNFSLFFILGAVNSWAQVSSKATEQVNSYLLKQSMETQGTAPTWQLTLDVIKAKAEALLQKNNDMMAQRDALLKQYNQEQKIIETLKKNNEEIRQFLKERHGRSDEQFKMDEIEAQIHQRKALLKETQDRLVQLNQVSEGLDQKIQLKKLRISDIQIDQKKQDLQLSMQQALKEKDASKDDDELIALKKKLHEQKEQEAVLEKQGDQAQLGMFKEPVQVSTEEINALEEKQDNLRHQKDDLQKRLNGDNNQANMHRYQELMLKKSELEEKIKGFEVVLNQLKESSKENLTDDKSNKLMLKQMIKIDNRNTQLKQKVHELQENVLVLRSQVRRLEKKVNFRR